jgi:hypothetical protein
MKRASDFSDRELDELIARGRTIRSVPDVVRARALARARTTVAAAAVVAPAASPSVAAPARGRGARIALAASIALAFGAAGAVAAVLVRTPGRFTPTSSVRPRMSPPVRIGAPELVMPIAPQEAPVAKAHHAARPVTPQESYAAELNLLQRAQVAYAGGDFSGALVLVADHARRFPNGRLAEEREALRVRSLARSGRTEEARRATATFANRFPRSVLLPRLRQIAGTPQ